LVETQREQRLERRERNRNRRILIILVAALVIGLIALQLLPYGRDHTNPPVRQEPAWNSDETRALVVRACYDCHSNETVWPWYSKVAPMSMLMYQDVMNGRAALNFSEWEGDAWTEADTERLIEMVAGGHMPLPYYGVLHPEARLNTFEQGQLINGLIETLELRDQAAEGIYEAVGATQF
jgi:hypothetical protein